MSGMTGTELEVVRERRYRRDSRRVERGFWRKVRRYGARVPFLREALAAYYCAIDPATPWRVKAVLMAALAYFVLPADMVPDFLPMLGFTDDAAVLLAAYRAVAPHVRDRHRDQARAALQRLGGS
jgi:uncharacterized membrane protein YkvA (DUF1232 family)